MRTSPALATSRVRAGSLALVVALGGACGGGHAAGPEHPMLLVGIDGMEPSIVDEMLEAGRLPNLAKFAAAGVVGRIDVSQPTYSPVLWTTIATGQDWDVHGIDHFRPMTGPDGEPLFGSPPYTSNCRKVPALWNLLSDAGYEVDVAGWWVTWPAEPIRGRMVSSYAAQAQFEIIWKGGLWSELVDQTYPPGLWEEIDPIIATIGEGEADLAEAIWETFEKPERPLTEHAKTHLRDLNWTLAGDRAWSGIAEHFLANDPGDLVMVYLALPDVAGHHLWRYHQPEDFQAYYEVPRDDVDDYGDWLRQSYEDVDRRLGRLVERAPENANIVVVSDHGMMVETTPELRQDPDEVRSGHHWEAPSGLFAAMGPTIRRQGNLIDEPRKGRLGHVLGVAPFVLYALELPVPEHWPGARNINDLNRILDDQWRVDHPLRKGPDRDAEFRPATPPLVPREGLDDQFFDEFAALGYGSVLGED